MHDDLTCGDDRETAEVFVTRRLPPEGEEVFRDAAVEFAVGEQDDESGLSRAALLEGTSRCRVLVSLLTESIDREVLQPATLLGVANMAVGYDNVDIDAATELGVPVSNTPGVLTETTADLTWALILAVARQLPQAHAYLTSGRFQIWGPNSFLGADVGRGGSGRRKVLGIVGFGRIGQAVARRAVGFEMDVLAYDPRHRERVEASNVANWAQWPELLRSSDFLTLHLPMTEEARHLVGEEELRAMRATAFLINTSRGPIVDEEALVRALAAGTIAGAGLDVYEHEPELAPGLAALDNVVLLPHIGSASADTRGLMAATAAANALAHLRCEPAPNVVNPEVYTTATYRRRVAGGV